MGAQEAFLEPRIHSMLIVQCPEYSYAANSAVFKGELSAPPRRHLATSEDVFGCYAE